MNDETCTSLYIIILNWNLPEETTACIESIREGYCPEETVILVVDNGSTDDSIERLTDYFGKSIQIIQNVQNLGFAAGVNVGVRAALTAKAEMILLLNNDTLVDKHMIAKLLAAAQEFPQAGLLGPAIYYHQAPTRIWRYGDNEHPWLPIPLQITDREVASLIPHPFQLDYITFCGALIRRDVFETIGDLDERYFMYFEDADFCRRTRNAGYEIWCIPQAKMWHKVSLSAQKDKPTNRYARSWGRIQFYRTHPHGRWPYLFHFYLTLKIIGITLSDILRGDWNLIRPLWVGTIRGYRD